MKLAPLLTAAFTILTILSPQSTDAKGGRARFSSSRARSSRSSAGRRSSASGYRPSTSCRSCYYSGGHYYHRTYYMYYYGAYYPCVSCNSRAQNDPTSEDSLTMDVPAISGTFTALAANNLWNETVFAPGSAEFKRFKDQFAQDIRALSNNLINADTVAIKEIVNGTGQLADRRRGTVGYRNATVSFLVLILDTSVSASGSIINALNTNCERERNGGAGDTCTRVRLDGNPATCTGAWSART
eukprot:SAG22_NODE_687_length_7913_cov_2.611851_6_plen_242_part_00